jgi:hypothetical protein
MTFSIPVPIAEKFQEEAHKSKANMSAEITKMIEAWLNTKSKEKTEDTNHDGN